MGAPQPDVRASDDPERLAAQRRQALAGRRRRCCRTLTTFINLFAAVAGDDPTASRRSPPVRLSAGPRLASPLGGRSVSRRRAGWAIVHCGPMRRRIRTAATPRLRLKAADLVGAALQPAGCDATSPRPDWSTARCILVPASGGLAGRPGVGPTWVTPPPRRARGTRVAPTALALACHVAAERAPGGHGARHNCCVLDDFGARPCRASIRALRPRAPPPAPPVGPTNMPPQAQRARISQGATVSRMRRDIV